MSGFANIDSKLRTFWAWWAKGSPETPDAYWSTKRAVASALVEAQGYTSTGLCFHYCLHGTSTLECGRRSLEKPWKTAFGRRQRSSLWAWLERLPQAKELKYLGMLFTSDGTVWACGYDASWAPPFGGFPGTPNWKETLRQTHNRLEILHLIWPGNTSGFPKKN